MKKMLFAAALVLATVSCDKKKEETGSITTQDTRTGVETATTTEVTSLDSATSVQQTNTATTTEKTTTTTTTTGEVTYYESHDGKTTFSAIYDADKGTAAVKNETSGKKYDMKIVPSGSGSKYQDKDGNFFWTHQGEFTIGKGDKDEIKGKEVK